MNRGRLKEIVGYEGVISDRIVHLVEDLERCKFVRLGDEVDTIGKREAMSGVIRVNHKKAFPWR